jgi:type II secretory pathway pseudopilin PulG
MRPSFTATSRCARGGERGFTYIGLLVAIFLMGLMLTVVARVWTTTEQREREIELIYIGHAYRMAISSYYAVGHRFPAALKDLLTDERFPIPKHHLRRLYADPMTGKADWTLIAIPTGGGIMGVASSSQAAPIKRDGFENVDLTFKDADCYCKWEFIYRANRWAVPGLPPNGPGSPGLQPGQPGPLNPTPPPTYPSGSPGAPLLPTN